MVGFETIGNATVTCIDDRPVLTTDPWIAGEPYFGSWTMPYEIPGDALEHVMQAEYMWLSHGHPDHVNPASLDRLAGKKILLPDHVGGRMERDLRELGFQVQVMPDRQWLPLSRRIRAMCVSDYHQDAILLIDIDGTLVVNLNDAVERGWGRFVRGIIRGYRRSFLLKLFGYGDVDMINIHTEDGTRLLPQPPTESPESRQYWDGYLEEKVRFWTRYFGTTHFIPFSIFHAYQRADSVWARPYTTPLATLEALRPPGCEAVPAFVRYQSGDLTRLSPRPLEVPVRDPKEFDDDWSVPLEKDDLQAVTSYFQDIEHLHGKVDFVRFRVGGREHHIDLGKGKRPRRGLTFELPRGSLMSAVKWQVFDDVLIGNYMRTTVHGDWGSALAPNILYRHFTPWVVRYADNAQVKTREALRDYMATYRRRAPVDYLMHKLAHEGVQKLRSLVKPGSPLFRHSTRMYSFLKGLGT